MSVRERIRTIRLAEKLQEHPEYATAFGIKVSNAWLPVGTDEKREE